MRAGIQTTRERAYEALLAVERDGMQSHLVIRRLRQEMQGEVRDRAFVLRLVEGTIERRLQLDYVINRFAGTKTGKMRPGIREILRMAVYQILYMDGVPDRAAVSEAVKLAEKKGFGGLCGFVNGVLRAVVRGKDEIVWPDIEREPVQALSVRYSIAEEIVAAWLTRYGAERTARICGAFLEDRPLTVHDFSEGQDALAPTEILDGAYFLEKGTDPAELPGFREGRLYVQDLSSQIAVASVGILPGERVLDLCAAPGGKSLLAAERGACVLARDLTEVKVKLIRENAARMRLLSEPDGLSEPAKKRAGDGSERTDERGIERCGQKDTADWQNGQKAGLCAEKADASVFDPALEEAFDVVFADLPCSGFGVAGKKPEIKYKPYRETVMPLAAQQRAILTNAVRYVRPGGKLLYSTCTIAVEENEKNARWLRETCGLHPAEMDETVRGLLRKRGIAAGEDGVQLLPCDGPWDGFFFALFQKTVDDN